MNITERFLKYVGYCTTSDETTGLTPSTPGQMEFAQVLRDELKQIGLEEVDLDENGYMRLRSLELISSISEYIL